MSTPAWALDEGAEKLVGSLLVQFADSPDDDPVPLRGILMTLVALVGASHEVTVDDVPEFVTVGELRELVRHSRERVANGDGPSRYAR